MAPPDSEKALLEDWWRRVREAQWAHYECSKRLSLANYLLGIPLVALAAFAGTVVFVNISSSEVFELKLAVGMTLVLIAVLGGLQTFLRLSDRASEHRSAGAEYSCIRRLIEEQIAGVGDQGVDRLSKIREGVDNLTERSPVIPSATWRRVETRLRRRTSGSEVSTS
jgi:hypothetical protein